jgi:hypothetical protein
MQNSSMWVRAIVRVEHRTFWCSVLLADISEHQVLHLAHQKGMAVTHFEVLSRRSSGETQNIIHKSLYEFHRTDWK